MRRTRWRELWQLFPVWGQPRIACVLLQDGNYNLGTIGLACPRELDSEQSYNLVSQSKPTHCPQAFDNG